MTLISVIWGNTYPVIVSDRAISDYSKFGKIVIPTTGRQTGEPTNVVDFRIKSIIIKDILCLAFAGIEWKIHETYDEIEDYFLHREVNEANLRQFLKGFEISNDLSVLFALGGPEFQDNKILVACAGIWFQDHTKENLDICAAGTGAQDWIKHITDYQAYLPTSGDKLTDCLYRAFIAAAVYTSKEWHSVEHLLDGWGGGFDLIYYANNSFHRCNELTHAFWYTSEENSEVIKFVAVNHNVYKGGNVIIYNIDRMRDNGMQVSIIPQFRGSEPLDKDQIILACKSEYIITSVFIKRFNGNMDTLAIALKEWNDEASPMFLAFVNEKQPQIILKPAYKDAIKEALKIYLG